MEGGECGSPPRCIPIRDGVMIEDLQVLEPVRNGVWTNIPIEPIPRVLLRAMCVIQNSLGGQGTRGSHASVRSLLLGTDDPAVVSELTLLEAFMLRAAKTVWGSSFGQLFQLELSPQIRKHAALAPFKYEVRLYCVGREDLAICDELSCKCTVREVCVGDYVDVSVCVYGMWCSANKCGLKHRIERVTLLRSRGNAIE